MSSSRVEWKVGGFVVIGLVIIAGLILQFSKGASFFTSTYEVLLKTRNVGGIKRGATVLMAGVPVGSVRGAELTADGREVIVRLGILREYSIYGDATFAIEEAGFLGDQYVAIVPTLNAAPILQHGALVTCQEPFNLQEAARSAAGFLQRMDLTVQKFNEVVGRLDRTLLAESTLTNLTATLANFNLVSVRTLAVADRLDGLVATNAPEVSAGVSNLLEFSHQLNGMARDLQETVATNRGPFTAAVKKIDAATALVEDLLTGLQAGQGLAGSLLQDQELRTRMNQTVSNLTVLSSNLARFGLLYKPRAPKPAEPRQPAPSVPKRN